MQKKKIVQVYKQAYPEYGGIEADINQIFDNISDDEFEKEIICCSNKYKSEIINGVKYTRCRYLFEFIANYISLELIYKLSKLDVDVIHYHMPCIFIVLAHYIARPKYKKMIISYHGGIYGYDKYMKYFNKLYTKFYDDADLIHVYTKNLIDSDEVLKANREKTYILPYSIPIKNYEIKQENKDFLQLLCMGRLVHWKGIQVAIKAMQNVEKAILYIVGDGPYKSTLEQLTKSLNVENKVKFLGKITDHEKKDNIFKNTDIFIFPSIRKSESFGQVQIQSMQYGVPVINTNLGTGVNFISINNSTGLTVEPNNVDELSSAINFLINNPEIRKIYGENSRQRVSKYFDLDKNKDKYRSLYL